MAHGLGLRGAQVSHGTKGSVGEGVGLLPDFGQEFHRSLIPHVSSDKHHDASRSGSLMGAEQGSNFITAAPLNLGFSEAPTIAPSANFISSPAIDPASPQGFAPSILAMAPVSFTAAATLSLQVSVGMTAAQINALIALAPPGSEVVFDPGTFILTEKLVIGRGDISIKGAGAGLTTLKFDLPAGQEGNFITIGDAAKTFISATTANAASGSHTLNLADAHALSVGDRIYIQVPNTQDYLTANGWTNVSMTDAATRPFREFITTVSAIDGNAVTLADAIPYDFAATDTKVSAVHMLDHVGLSDFTITSTFAAGNPYSFSNTLPAYDSTSAINALGTDGLVLSGINIINSPSSGLTLTSSINADVSKITVQGSLDKGGDGNGYGVLLAESFNNHLSGLTILDMRHAFILSAWNAETGNVVQIDLTNRDINFHGSPDIGNVVTVNKAVLDYNLAIDPSVWALVSPGGKSHAATDIYGDNIVKFAYASGHNKVDILYGVDTGAYLNGHGSNDTLIGGAGDDILVGGLRRDTMTGNGGSDLFILKTGDDLDTITDFQFGVGGDHIAFIGSSVTHGMSDLRFTQVGADLYVRYGLNSTVILQHHTVADVKADNFVFDSAGVIYGDLWV